MTKNEERTKAVFPRAVCRKVRGEGRYRITDSFLTGIHYGDGETRAAAWRNACHYASIVRAQPTR